MRNNVKNDNDWIVVIESKPKLPQVPELQK